MSNMASDSGEECSELSKSPQEFTEEDIRKLKNRGEENVEDLPPEVPLQSRWTFWLDKSIPGLAAEEFTKTLRKIYSVDTVQGFWAVFNNIPTPDELQFRCSYHLMKDERRPVWEDEVNENGGTWRFTCHKRDTPRVWKELLLAAIGEQFVDCMAEEDEICGVTVTVREKDDLIQVWNQLAGLSNKANVLKKIHELVPDVYFPKEFYKPHQTHHSYSGMSNPSKPSYR